MCIDITMIDQADADKLVDLLNDLNDNKPLGESRNPLGIILALTALLLQAGETLHLMPPELIGELAQRAQVNGQRAMAGEPPLLAKDWERIDLEKRLAELKGEQPDSQPGSQPSQGVEAPNPYKPGESPTILPPKDNGPDESGDGFGLYL